MALTRTEGIARIGVVHDTEFVKGTPDEVHAKLSPEAAGIADVAAALTLLQRILENPTGFLPHTVILAEKALGKSR